jgi:hypothetical protein
MRGIARAAADARNGKHRNHLRAHQQHGVIQVKKFVLLAITFLLALGSAAIVAYAMAHIAHHSLGFSRSALREQALICAALLVGLVTIELLASKER